MRKLAVRINVPNALTLTRILLTPVFAICLIRHLFGSALLVFAVAAITDGLDGFIARVFRRKTTLGAYLDPTADKLLLTTAFITLAIQGMIPGWLTVIVITRDVVILFGVGLLNIMNRSFEASPSMLSKITTVSQLATVCAVLLVHQTPLLGQVERAFFWSTACLTTASGLQYMYRGLSILQEDNHAQTSQT
jgi:cardiolipin synthase